MNEIFNFSSTAIIFEHNWVWLGLAFLIGAWVGFTTSVPSKKLK